MPGIFSKIGDKKKKPFGLIGKAAKTFADYQIGGAKAIGETVVGATSLVEKGLEATTQGIANIAGIDRGKKGSTVDQVFPKEMFKGKNTTQKVGKTVADVAMAFAPTGAGQAVTASAKATKAAQAVTKGAPRIAKAIEKLSKAGGLFAEGAAFQATKAREVDRSTASAGALSAVLPGAAKLGSKTVRGASRFFGSILKNADALVAGKNVDLVEQILKEPDEALKGLSGDTTKTISELVESAQRATGTIRKNIRTKFGEVLEDIPEDLNLSLEGVKRNVGKALREFDVAVGDGLDDISFSSTKFDRAETNRLQEAVDSIIEWDDMSGKGLDNLAQKLNNFKKGEQTSALNSLLSKMSDSVRSYLGEQYEPYRAVVSEYAETMNFLEEVSAALATKEGQKAATTKISQKIGTLFNTNKDIARQFVAQLEERTGEKILGKAAGQQFSQGVSKTDAKLGDFVRGIVQTIINPKVLGQMTAWVGKAQKAAVRPAESIRKALGDEYVDTINAAYTASGVSLAEFVTNMKSLVDAGAEEQGLDGISDEEFELIMQAIIDESPSAQAIPGQAPQPTVPTASNPELDRLLDQMLGSPTQE